jgi:cell division ATPase FtsA
MSFLFNRKKDKIVAVFDIGSGSVGGAMARIPFDKNTKPTILKSVRSNEINFKKGENNFHLFLDGMIQALNQTAKSLYDKKIGAPDEIFCIFASPWYLSKTKIIKVNRENSFVFTKRLADELINKEINNFKKTYEDKYNKTEEGAPEIIEKHIMAVFLNGYLINEPIGVSCKSLEINLIISLAPKLCLEKIRETLFKTFHRTKINFSSFSLSTYLAVRDKYVYEDSYLLIDISGEITDVGIVTKGVLKTVLSFPFGKKTFFNYICTKLDIELRDAKEIFKLYSEDKLSADLRVKVEPLLKSVQNSWGESFSQCVNSLPQTLLLPDMVFLTADNDIKNWFADVLRNEKYTQSIGGSDRKCTVITLEGHDFFNMCDVKEGPLDPFLMIGVISIMRKLVD